MIKSAQYTNIFFNPFNHFYYRTIIGDLVQKDSTGTKRTYQDKNRYCQVFDSNLSFLYEFKLPKQTWVEYLMLPNQTGFTCTYGIRNVKDNYFKFLKIRQIK